MKRWFLCPSIALALFACAPDENLDQSALAGEEVVAGDRDLAEIPRDPEAPGAAEVASVSGLELSTEAQSASTAELSCSHLQWWNSPLTYAHVVLGWHDTDLAVHSSTPVQLRHRSRLDHWGVYGWGYMPEFTDLVTGRRFRLLHLRPQHKYATSVGHVYPEGFVVGISGGDTRDTGYGTYSTGAHLCVQSLVPYRTAFPRGHDPCR